MVYNLCCFWCAFRKDNILFRRTKVKRVPCENIGTQSQITCRPNAFYELKRVDDESQDKSVERNHRRDENHTNSNPFSKSKELVETKTNQRANHVEKNGDHRHQSRNASDHNNVRGKHCNLRNKDDDRRDQSNVDRNKRRRSRSLSKDRKRARRSRSRRRERNAHERHSPDKSSQTQVCFGHFESNDSTKRETCFSIGIVQFYFFAFSKFIVG